MRKVLLVDDHTAVAEGTKKLIESDPDFQVDTITSSIAARDQLKKESYDVVLIDLNMPDLNGLELTEQIIRENSDVIILIYTGFDFYSYFNLLIEAGVSGFISKTATQEQIVTSIRCALRGEVVLPIQLVKQLRKEEAKVDDELRDISLNKKELAILAEVAKGLTNRIIAENLVMSQRTVEYHLTAIFNKLGVQSRTEALTKSKKLGLMPEEII